jgi:hypothetical protein
VDALAANVLARFLEREGYGTGRGWEHRKERDERVLVNLPPHLHTLWNKLKLQFKGTPEERMKNFLEYVEENPGEDMAGLQDAADKALNKLIREYKNRPEPEYSEVPF